MHIRQSIKDSEKKILTSFLRILISSKSKKEALVSSLKEITHVGWLPIHPKGGIFLVSKDNPQQIELYTTTANFSPELHVLCAKIDFGHCICGRAASTKEIVFVDCVDDKHDVRFDGISAHGHYSVPFFDSNNQLQGVLVLYVEHGHKATKQECEFLKMISFGLGAVCERFEKEDQIKADNIKLKLAKAELDATSLVSRTDLKGAITYVNDKFCMISKYSREELIGQHHRIINSAFHSREFWKGCWETISRGKIFRGEVCNQAKDGSKYWVETTIFPIFDQAQNITGYSAVRLDITSKKNTEKKIQHQSKLASIGEMASSVGHEINNPLAIVSGNITLIKRIMEKEKIKSPQIEDKILKIQDANGRIRGIVDGLRTFSRVDSDELTLVSMREAIDKTVNLVSDMYKRDGISIIVEDKNTQLYTMGILGKVQQIIMNLLSNAKDATISQQSREICIALKAEGIGKCLRLSISDNGTGMSDEVKRKVLEPFFTTKGEGVGTGIGLGLVRNYVDGMHGKVEISTELGVGSTFSIIIPSVPGDAISPPLLSTPTLADLGDSIKGQALVVDDEALIREILVEYLEGMGLSVDCADDGDTALEMVNKKKYDFILTDMKMPRMSGDKFIEEAQKGVNDKAGYIVITGGMNSINTPEKRKALRNMVDTIILKPFNEEIIHDAIVKIKKKN